MHVLNVEFLPANRAAFSCHWHIAKALAHRHIRPIQDLNVKNAHSTFQLIQPEPQRHGTQAQPHSAVPELETEVL